jgi:hypothetical protein
MLWTSLVYSATKVDQVYSVTKVDTYADHFIHTPTRKCTAGVPTLMDRHRHHHISHCYQTYSLWRPLQGCVWDLEPTPPPPRPTAKVKDTNLWVLRRAGAPCTIPSAGRRRRRRERQWGTSICAHVSKGQRDITGTDGGEGSARLRSF